MLIDKLTVTQLVKFQPVVEPGVSLLYSQESTIALCPKSDEPSPPPQNLFTIHFSITFPYMPMPPE